MSSPGGEISADTGAAVVTDQNATETSASSSSDPSNGASDAATAATPVISMAPPVGGRTGGLLNIMFKEQRTIWEKLRSALGVRFHIDRKAIERLLRQLDKVIRQCRDCAHNLSQSPPSLLELLPRVHRHVQEIVRKNPPHDENLRQLDACAPFRLTIENLTRRCKQLSQMLRYTVGSEGSPTSQAADLYTTQYSQEILMITIVFNYVDQELTMFFPKGVFVGENALDIVLRKQAAREFWKKNFEKQAIVPWRDFIRAFGKEHSVDSEEEESALRNAIDLTWNDHVSLFELDVFSRLFQPWDSLLKNWRFLTLVHPAFMAYLTHEQVGGLLGKHSKKPGSYFFRFSTTSMGSWSIAYVTPEGRVKQIILKNEPLIPALKEGERTQRYLYPAGQSKNPELNDEILEQANVRLKENREEFITYSEAGCTYTLCKVCYCNEKNRRLEPCGHLMCSQCLQDWLKRQRKQVVPCPFCREPVQGTEAVSITPFVPDPNLDPDLCARLELINKKAEVGSDDEKNKTEDGEGHKLSASSVSSAGGEDEDT